MEYKILFTILSMFPLISYGAQRLPVVGLNESLRIPPHEISILKKKAEHGDGKAAERLSSYYGLYLSDKKMELYYLKLGAKNNSDIAIRNLMTIYSTDSGLFDLPSALIYRHRLKNISKSKKIAIESDAEWSYDLYTEHFVGYGNKKRGLLFLEYAAKRGSDKARRELIQIYSNDPDVQNPAKARYWKKKSR